MILGRGAATLTGMTALAMWGMLATLTSFATTVPPLQLTAMTLGIGGLVGVFSWTFRPGAWRALLAPKRAWTLGLFGLCGYHLCYFTALKLAPAVEASLIAYLWPLLIVLLAAFLPGERLRAAHIPAAMLGFLGAGLLVSGGKGLSLNAAYLPGYATALACAFIWSSYSVLSRLLGSVSSDSIAGFCLLSAVIAAIAHLFFEPTMWPANIGEWVAVLLLGLFPTGLAFYAWDIGMKRGDIQMLGILSYATPVVSTLLLALFGRASLTWTVAAAMGLVTLAAILAGWGTRAKTGQGASA